MESNIFICNLTRVILSRGHDTELDKLDIPSLEGIYEKVQSLLAKKRSIQNDSNINQAEVDRINAVYDKIPQEEQLASVQSSMRTMWEAVKNDTW